MNAQLSLFQTDIDEEDFKPVPKVVVRGRKPDRGKELLGRCLRCGGHIESEPVYCLECLGSAFCDCHECRQIASLHRMLQNDLYICRRSVEFGDIDRIRHYALQAENMRHQPKCSEVTK